MNATRLILRVVFGGHVASGTGDRMTEAPMRRRQMLTADRAKLCTKLTALCLALLAAPLYGQSDLTATSRGTVSYGSPTFAVQNTSDLQMQSPYLGGVPAGRASATALALSLEDAVGRGLRQNLGGWFPAMRYPAHMANDGRHSVRCCQI